MNKEKAGKKKIWIWVAAVVAVVLVAVAAVLIWGNGKQAYRTVSVIEVSGSVEVMKDGVGYSAYPGMMLQEGHEIVTSAGSFVRLVLDSDKYVKLEEDSKLTFETLGTVGSGKTKLHLECGALTTELVNPLAEDEEYVVNTPNAVLAVRGTFFRVDTRMKENGEVVTDVKTYGGAVASKRIMPDGAVVEEEVLIESGFKTSIKKDDVVTVYVVAGVEKPSESVGDTRENTEPIVKEEISDEDLIDIYFAVQNGHDLFTTAEEVKSDLEVRNIDVTQETSVYEKAEKVLEILKEPVESETESATEVPETETPDTESEEISTETEESVAETEEPGVEVEESDTETEEPDVENKASDTEVEEPGVEAEEPGAETEQPDVEPEIPVEPETPTEPDTPVEPDVPTEPETPSQPEVHTHQYRSDITTPATCTEKGVRTYSCNCGESYTEEIDVIDHREILAGTELVHSKCGICGMPMSSDHVLVERTVLNPTCTEVGEKVFACECEYSYTEEISATGHTEVNGGLADVHKKCETCGEPLVDGSGHELQESRDEATCEEDGLIIRKCDCGYRYEEVIPAGGHTEIAGGLENVHSKCEVCGEPLKDGSSHEYEHSVTDATCTVDGLAVHTCECGYTYSEVITAAGHTEANGGLADVHKKCGECGEVLADGSEHSFTETTLEGNCLYNGILRHTCECGYTYDTELSLGNHTPSNGGLENVHSMCGSCGTTLEDGSYHSFTENRTEPTCTASGMLTETCSCGYVRETVIPKTDHNWEFVGTQEMHRKCTTCVDMWEGENYHSFTDRVLTPATCTTDGTQIYECECGYSYTTTIVRTGHVEVPGGTEGAHSKCDNCGEVILDGNYHSMGTHVNDATCTTDGLQTESCSCGYVKETVLPKTGHVKADEYADETYCTYCGQRWIDINENTFGDEAFRNYVLTKLDKDSDGKLLGQEVLGVTEIDVSGTPETDGGYTTLTGLRYFPNLNMLYCDYNAGITTIDLSGCNNLTMVNCQNTGITSLDFLSAIASSLTYLDCSNNAITNITPEAFTALQYLECRNTQIGSITLNDSSVCSVDLSGSVSLTQVSAEGMMYLQSITLDDCNSLQIAYIWGNDQLTGISLKNATSLFTLWAKENPMLRTIDLEGGGTLLSTFDVTDSATSGSSLSVNAVGSGLDKNTIVGWDDAFMTLTQ